MGGAFITPPPPQWGRPTCEVQAKDVACPKCKAGIGHRCRRGRWPYRRIDTIHEERVSRAALKHQP